MDQHDERTGLGMGGGTGLEQPGARAAGEAATAHRLHRKQVVAGRLGEVFEFFKDPCNLETITPPWLGFRIRNSTDREVRLGTRITYGLRLHGIPLKWESRISEFVEGECFADEMIAGPYRRWYHRHLFRPVAGGVEIEDVVDYTLPLGPVGRLAHTLLVRRQLETIFAYRERQIAKLFQR